MKTLGKIILIAAIFSAGAAGGYYFGSKKSVVNQNKASDTCKLPAASNDSAISFDTDNQKIRTGMKINLLQDYIKFVFLSKEELGDPKQYADTLQTKVSAIRDEDLSNKFSATGTATDGERGKKVLDFINAIVESIRKEVIK